MYGDELVRGVCWSGCLRVLGVMYEVGDMVICGSNGGVTVLASSWLLTL